MKLAYLLTLCLFITAYAFAQCITGTNVALNKPAFASSIENAGTIAANAFDGNLTTRWSSEASDPQYIYIDLEVQYELCQVTLNWEAAYATDFTIDISNDALTWTTVATITGNTSQTNIINITGTARYVRMNGIARATGFGYSLYEFQVFAIRQTRGCSPENRALNQPSIASTSQETNNAGNAFDGNFTTRWASIAGDPQSLQVDLGAVYNLCQVALYWEVAYAADYTIDASTDGFTWTTLAVVTGNTVLTNTININGVGRYVRMTGLVRATGFGYSLYEFQVFTFSLLPVKLTYFNAEKQNKEARLRWATAMESNSDVFIIERSNDGRNFSAIGQVKAAGNSAVTKTYNFTDASPVSGVNYYRLKQHDLDAKYEYSKIEQVNFSTTQLTGISIYPNPVNSIANITSNTGERINSVRIYSFSGSLMGTYINSGTTNKMQVSLQQFTAGVYMMEILTNSGKQVSRIVKQ